MREIVPTEVVFDYEHFLAKTRQYVDDLNRVHVEVNGVYTEVTKAELYERTNAELWHKLLGAIPEAKVKIYVPSKDFDYVPVVQICFSFSTEPNEY